MAVDLSILIATHNRCGILARTLESVAGLAVPADVDAEVVVVANACDDATEQTAAAWAGRIGLPLRCVAEPTPGLSVARNRCMAEARGEVLAFIDDDVWLDAGWIDGLMSVYRDRGADLVGGPVDLWWEEVDRPAWWSAEMDGKLSRVDHGTQVKQLTSPYSVIGANFSFTRQVYQRVGQFNPALGRTGANLMAGEESDYIQRAMNQGFQLYYAPEAKLKHWVQAKRITTEYLGGIAYGNAVSRQLMKPRIGFGGAVRVVVGHLYLIVRHGTAEAVGRLRGDKATWLPHYCRRRAGVGGIAGLWRRRASAPPGSR